MIYKQKYYSKQNVIFNSKLLNYQRVKTNAVANSDAPPSEPTQSRPMGQHIHWIQVSDGKTRHPLLITCMFATYIIYTYNII